MRKQVVKFFAVIFAVVLVLSFAGAADAQNRGLKRNSPGSRIVVDPSDPSGNTFYLRRRGAINNRIERTENVDKNETITIGGGRTENVAGGNASKSRKSRNRDIAVENDETHWVGRDRSARQNRNTQVQSLIIGTDGGIWKTKSVNRNGIIGSSEYFARSRTTGKKPALNSPFKNGNGRRH